MVDCQILCFSFFILKHRERTLTEFDNGNPRVKGWDCLKKMSSWIFGQLLVKYLS